ncbi:MAG: bifunctional nuclease family protein [Candidatus Tectomicrobia bacterium]|nr:bifunctional nuclease family protein [Candidatus Tectomicrobia bacterium]
MRESKLRATGKTPGRPRLGRRLATAVVCAILLFLPALPGRADPQEERMKVRDVVLDPRSQMPVLVLEDAQSGRKVLPLWIGVSEANAILMALREVAVPRPMTHDLLKNLLHDLQARVLRVLITDLRESTFIATIYLRSGEKDIRVDSRPSDAVALALRTDAPIFVSAGVLARAGQMQPEGKPLTSELEAYGLSVQEITPELVPHFRGAAPRSILITDVRQGSQAERDGLKRGDVILHVDDVQVRGLESFLGFLREADARKRAVRVVVHRGDGRVNLTLSQKK